MDSKQISDSEVLRIYAELRHRIQRIGIALHGKKIKSFQEAVEYDLGKNGMPNVGETVYAFLHWNCAILTAFRGIDPDDLKKWTAQGMSPKEIKAANKQKNLDHNEELKAKLREQNLLFRAVDGWYKEYDTEEYVQEMSMFVTNTNVDGKQLDEKEFFIKLFRLSEHYQQDCFLFTFSGLNRVAFLVATSDNGRRDLNGDILFAGPLFTHIEGLDAWTQCKDGKISFMLKGMIIEGGTGNKKVKTGEGDIFDVDAYSPDGLVVIRKEKDDDLQKKCQGIKTIPVVDCYFENEEQTADEIYRMLINALNFFVDKKYKNKEIQCKKIGLLCTATIDGSTTKAASVVLDTVKKWADKKGNKLDWIVLSDIYGEYGKILNEK